MNKDRLELLKSYIEIAVAPILVSNISSDFFDNSVIIKSTIDIEKLNGHYEDVNFCPPKWYDELIKKSKDGFVFLVIENINEISIEEQIKFIEILKYKKVNTFKLPENSLVIVTSSDLSKINRDIYSLLVQI